MGHSKCVFCWSTRKKFWARGFRLLCYPSHMSTPSGCRKRGLNAINNISPLLLPTAVAGTQWARQQTLQLPVCVKMLIRPAEKKQGAALFCFHGQQPAAAHRRPSTLPCTRDPRTPLLLHTLKSLPRQHRHGRYQHPDLGALQIQNTHCTGSPGR